MVRDYDAQLLESVVVRRRRLRDALLFGPQRTRRKFTEGTMKIVAGLCVAAVVCAGLVGVSFLRSMLSEQKRQKDTQTQAAVPLEEPTAVPAGWVGARVTFPMLRKALDQAEIPHSLYVLPGRSRPHAVSSYYVIVKGADRYSGGVVEFEQGRISAEFPSEDEACRWLYGELIVPEHPPRSLDARAEQDAIGRGKTLAADARRKVAQDGSASVTYSLPEGTLVDAFGQESGSVLFPFGLPFGSRGLPAQTRAASAYHRYRVVKPFAVRASVSAPAGRSPGGDVRFTVNAGLFQRPPALPTVRWLRRVGYLEPVAGTSVPR
ncbi:DUF4237 domain-containing protein [Actinomadura darangshiensis]|uniref:DUF4237 domain-containing protein n=1 Tax=Actinomadura darangshiensis TaxID=705336 RepID=A0A4V2YWJ0_9ACTN|nr:TNT domain-containing protein [Actinomadura darangshiensis]TDD85597.1 DUF4237 domain-containing protein [Actinomadura darangshiensis]